MTFKESLEANRELLIDQINNPLKYNVINFFKRGVANYKLAMANLMPYIVAIVITLPSAKALNRTPFITDEVKESINIVLIDSSNGKHDERLITGNYVPVTLEYSTGWKINEYNLYERTQTRYILSGVDINDHDFIFSMTKEELDNTLIPMEQQVITKETLTDEDKIHNEELITICSLERTNAYKSVEESKMKNVLDTILYTVICVSIGKTLNGLGKVIFHDKFKNKVREEKLKYIVIDEKQMEILKAKLQLAEKDLELFEEGKVR